MTGDTCSGKYPPPLPDVDEEERRIEFRQLQLARDAGGLTDEGERLYQHWNDHLPPKTSRIRCTPGYESWYDGTAREYPSTTPQQITTVEIVAREIYSAEISEPGHVPRSFDAAVERYHQILNKCRYDHPLRSTSLDGELPMDFRGHHDR